MASPKWLGLEKSTRYKSAKQENRLAKEFGGRTTPNSGATFGENDIKTKAYEIEAKTTESSQFIVKMDTIKTMVKKCKFDKVPLLVVEFAKHDEEIVILRKDDFLLITGYDNL